MHICTCRTVEVAKMTKSNRKKTRQVQLTCAGREEEEEKEKRKRRRRGRRGRRGEEEKEEEEEEEDMVSLSRGGVFVPAFSQPMAHGFEGSQVGATPIEEGMPQKPHEKSV